MNVGQRVVCVIPHSQGLLTKGTIYTIVGIKIASCCGVITVSVGIPFNHIRFNEGALCTCGTVHMGESEYYFLTKYFAPVEEKGETFIEDYYMEVTKSDGTHSRIDAATG